MKIKICRTFEEMAGKEPIAMVDEPHVRAIIEYQGDRFEVFETEAGLHMRSIGTTLVVEPVVSNEIVIRKPRPLP